MTVEEPRREELDPTLHEPFVPPLLKAWKKQGKLKIRQRTVPEHMTDVAQGMTVYDAVGTKLGTVQGVIADKRSRQASHLIVHRLGTSREEQRMVPVGLVDYVIRSDVYLRINKDQVQELTLYRFSDKERA
jgi:sporulation protein YlmC with PRC-barrel domain